MQYNDLISLLGHKKVDKAKILKSYGFYIKCLKLNPNQSKERCHAPFRVALPLLGKMQHPGAKR